MVPLRFVTEFFGAVVNWDGDTRGIEVIWSPNMEVYFGRSAQEAIEQASNGA